MIDPEVEIMKYFFVLGKLSHIEPIRSVHMIAGIISSSEYLKLKVFLSARIDNLNGLDFDSDRVIHSCIDC